MDDNGRTDTAYGPYDERLDNHIVEGRYDKIQAIRAEDEQPYPNDFRVTHTAVQLFERLGALDKEQLEALDEHVGVAGRVRFIRNLGKVMFIKIQDRTCRPGAKPSWQGEEPADDYLQIFVSKRMIGDEGFERLKDLDLGDIIGVRGPMMRTKTGELSVGAEQIRLLAKSIRPLPEKFKGLADVEQRLRQRYVDLIVNPEVSEVFRTRARAVAYIRRFLDERDFLEVETPMMHPTAGGAAARPFVTHHNALGMELFMRIAPELYLKRLLVGGFERVHEINRNFRNEGLSRQHNPEFTMLEFYQAYARHEDLMALTEEMVGGLVDEVCGGTVIEVEGNSIDFSTPWRRASVSELVQEALACEASALEDAEFLRTELAKTDVSPADAAEWDHGKLLVELFEHHVEGALVQPTFVTDYPASVSPLARRRDDDPRFVERFELIVLGREIANGFSELNDPEDQYERFRAQLAARARGDEEAMPMDTDYVRALEYGMPPAAGEGIGIDRLVMLLTDSESIRDVILFPLLRPE